MSGMHQALHEEIIHRLLEGAADTISREPLHSTPGIMFLVHVVLQTASLCGAALLELSANTP